MIRVIDNGWGIASVKYISAVLESANHSLAFRFATQPAVDIHVKHGDLNGSPYVSYDRAVDGSWVIQLPARDLYWAQYAYQFLHELCHVLTNFERLRQPKNQWFQEAICETASLYGLREMARTWAHSPPYEIWAGFAVELDRYADNLVVDPRRRMGRPPSEWFTCNREFLATNPYERSLLNPLSNALLPHFEERPWLWRAFSYLNLGESNAAVDFPAYLACWRSACPEQERETVAFFESLLLAPTGSTVS